MDLSPRERCELAAEVLEHARLLIDPRERGGVATRGAGGRDQLGGDRAQRVADAGREATDLGDAPGLL